MAYSPFSAGTLPIWRHPVRIQRSRSSIDKLTGTYFCPVTTELNPGDLCPDYPGMVITDFVRESTGLSRRYEITAEGNADGSTTTKWFETGFTVTLDEGWDQRTRRGISWKANKVKITASYTTGIFSSTTPHRYNNGDQIVLNQLTGGTGLAAYSLVFIPSPYYIIDATELTFRVSETAGGSAVSFAADVTAGYAMSAEIAPGLVHADFPYMYLWSADVTTDESGWSTIGVTWKGLEFVRPWRRRMSTGAQTLSGETNAMFINSVYSGYHGDLAITDVATVAPVISGGIAQSRGIQMDVPIPSITDSFISTSAPPVDYVGRYWTPYDAPAAWVPDIPADSNAQYTYHVPYGWKCVNVESEQIPGRSLWLISMSWSYQQQKTLT